MATLFLISILLIISCNVLTISCNVLTMKGQDETGFVGSLDPKSLGIGKPKTLSHFRFYWQEQFSEPNATDVRVVPPLPKYNTSTFFGSIGVFDNPLTAGPDLNSEVLGRAEGFYGATSLTVYSLSVIRTFYFTQGKYNGSTITSVGRNPAADLVREQAVVGGTGVFRFATGYVESKTISFDPQTRNNIIEFNVYVYY